MNSLKHKNYTNENTLTKSPWHNWLIRCIPELIKNMVGSVQDKIMSLFKSNTTKNFSKPTRVNNMYGG